MIDILNETKDKNTNLLLYGPLGNHPLAVACKKLHLGSSSVRKFHMNCPCEL
jgi:hypothetical protein